MKSYLKQTLAVDETVVYVAKVHWAIFLWPILWTLLSFGFLIFITAPWFVISLVRRFSTDLAATDRRIIAKTGLISRRVIEQRLAKVDSIRVDQGIIGRMLGYGTIYIAGSGISATPFKNIAKPLDFKRGVELQVERYETQWQVIPANAGGSATAELARSAGIRRIGTEGDESSLDPSDTGPTDSGGSGRGDQN